jgi:hypothetical protein
LTKRYIKGIFCVKIVEITLKTQGKSLKYDVQNATRKISGDLIAVKNGFPDTISFWIAAYFRFEVTTSKSSQKVHKKDLTLSRDFMIAD